MMMMKTIIILRLTDNNLFIQLNEEKFNIIFDYQKFNNQCHEINMLLAKHGCFLKEWKNVNVL